VCSSRQLVGSSNKAQVLTGKLHKKRLPRPVKDALGLGLAFSQEGGTLARFSGDAYVSSPHTQFIGNPDPSSTEASNCILSSGHSFYHLLLFPENLQESSTCKTDGTNFCTVLAAHTCNPSYLGGRDREDGSLRPAHANSS
jgi:hypothetical protein